MAAKAFEGPGVLRFDVAKQGTVAALRQHTKKSFPGGIPAIFDLRDGQKRLAELEEARRFVGFVSGVTDDLNRLHKIT
jgi:hypothetical protein